MLNSIIWILAISVTTCSNQANDQSGANEVVSESSANPSQNIGSSITDSLITGKTELANIYSQAIEAYIAAVYKKDKTNFETLFLGKRIDFPDIDLPAEISGTKILLLTPEESAQHKPAYSKTSPYINLIGFVENGTAEFIFVTFYPEYQHQYDCYMNFIYNPEKKAFDLDKLRIEVLVRNQEGKAEHYAIYENGKYVGDKPIAGNQN